MTPTFYSQRDPRWHDLKLGRGNLTIGQAGCLLTCCSMVLHDVTGVDFTPDALNRWLIMNDRFARGNEIVLASEPFVPLGMRLTEPLIFCEKSHAPMEKIAVALAVGKGVIVKVDFGPGGVVDMHYVRVLSVSDDDCYIADPWMLPGYSYIRLMPRYAAPEWKSPAIAILRVAIFGRADGKQVE